MSTLVVFHMLGQRSPSSQQAAARQCSFFTWKTVCDFQCRRQESKSDTLKWTFGIEHTYTVWCVLAHTSQKHCFEIEETTIFIFDHCCMFCGECARKNHKSLNFIFCLHWQKWILQCNTHRGARTHSYAIRYVCDAVICRNLNDWQRIINANRWHRSSEKNINKYVRCSVVNPTKDEKCNDFPPDYWHPVAGNWPSTAGVHFILAAAQFQYFIASHNFSHKSFCALTFHMERTANKIKFQKWKLQTCSFQFVQRVKTDSARSRCGALIVAHCNARMSIWKMKCERVDFYCMRLEWIV